MLASQELGEEDADKRPSVQIGDPFTGKKLIEASLELVEGRAWSSRCRTAVRRGSRRRSRRWPRDGAGVDVELDRVPLREELEPWEIMISESQERMVAVVRARAASPRPRPSARKWELAHAVIGEVTDTGELRAFHDGELVGAIPAGVPHRRVPALRGRAPARTRRLPPRSSPTAATARGSSSATTSSSARAPCAGRDSTPPCCGCGPRSAGSRCRSTGRRSASAIPFRAGALAVLGAARNVACVGGEPLALTDCLNFGNPEKPEIGWELEQAIEGIAQAAEALGIPVVSGNVSLYNDTDGRSIPPTPVVGCVGLVPNVRASRRNGVAETPSAWFGAK